MGTREVEEDVTMGCHEGAVRSTAAISATHWQRVGDATDRHALSASVPQSTKLHLQQGKGNVLD